MACHVVPPTEKSINRHMCMHTICTWRYICIYVLWDSIHKAYSLRLLNFKRNSDTFGLVTGIWTGVTRGERYCRWWHYFVSIALTSLQLASDREICERLAKVRRAQCSGKVLQVRVWLGCSFLFHHGLMFNREATLCNDHHPFCFFTKIILIAVQNILLFLKMLSSFIYFLITNKFILNDLFTDAI